jgi:hypothetical protein
MSLNEKTGSASEQSEELSPELDLALREFRQSIHAWSDAVMNRPRQALAEAPRRQVWRLAAGWALSCVLIVGVVSAGVVEYHRQQIKISQVRLPERPRLVLAPESKPETQPEAKENDQQARLEDEDLLAKVDSDVSRAVPSAMEPLAQLMTADESKDATE